MDGPKSEVLSWPRLEIDNFGGQVGFVDKFSTEI